ncbi:MAG: sulfite exporter TauE/SafE family protein [Alphaproteobacteria bacterium]
MIGDWLSSLEAFCGGHSWLGELAAALGAAGLPAALFLVGLVGGVSHCAAMCGPFVLAQVTADAERLAAPGLGELRRLRGALLLPYQLGRLTTYTALGAAAGGLGGLAAALSGYHWLLGAFLLLAALLLLVQALSGFAGWFGVRGPSRLGQALAAPLTRLSRPLLADPRGLRGYALGLALGFLPCGFLYGALTAAAGSGGVLPGALAMAGFALGTVPSLVLVGYVGVFFGRHAPRAARALSSPLMLANAGFLGFLALRALG